jgi:hypothetical protein
MVRSFIPLILLLLIAVSTLPFTASVQATDKKGRLGTCFAVAGTNPQGLSFAAYFYHRAWASRQAAAWIAAGWTGVTISGC